MDVETIWRGDYGHANIANDISLPPVDIPLNPNASNYKIKTRTTGHWFGGFQNCAEFCPKLHHVKINGVKEFEWLNWKECATTLLLHKEELGFTIELDGVQAPLELPTITK